ncbi:MAG: bifunctional 4-hydroxy-2-oxoglutarate aldolase/2-dehydro-3-deoxy-phosphogluconate aldolase [Mucilaginibacter sp.]
MNAKFSWELFETLPVVGIMRNLPADQIEAVAQTYHKSGFTCLEITMNSAGAEENIAEFAKIYAGKLNIGAGTVCSMHDLEKALKANAQFIVTPIINEEVIKTCVSAQIPIFPGAYTPSEIYKAWHLGASMVKVFPATALGPQYIKEVLAPLNYLKLLPTGGINFENFTSYLAAGAKGVGMGGHLFPADIIQNKDWDALGKIYVALKEKYQPHLK